LKESRTRTWKRTEETEREKRRNEGVGKVGEQMKAGIIKE
jgi:hypothetical protein